MHRSLIAIAALGALTLVAPGAARAAETVEVVGIEALTEGQRSYISKTGAEVVRHIQAAQKLASTSDAAGAQRETGKALNLMKGVEGMSPSERIKDAIAGVIHKIHHKTAKPDDLMPVETDVASVTQIEGLGVAETKTRLASARQHLAKGSYPEAEAELVVASESVNMLKIDLPIHETEVRLMRAIVFLSASPNPDLPNAKAALDDAYDHAKEFTAQASETVVEGAVEKN